MLTAAVPVFTAAVPELRPRIFHSLQLRRGGSVDEAGNDDVDYRTVGSPGVVPSAITAGSGEPKNDRTAGFPADLSGSSIDGGSFETDGGTRTSEFDWIDADRVRR